MHDSTPRSWARDSMSNQKSIYTIFGSFTAAPSSGRGGRERIGKRGEETRVDWKCCRVDWKLIQGKAWSRLRLRGREIGKLS